MDVWAIYCLCQALGQLWFHACAQRDPKSRGKSPGEPRVGEKNHLTVRIVSSPFRTKCQHGFELRAISCCFSEPDRTPFETLRTFSRPAPSWTSSRLCQSGSWLCRDDIGEHKPRYIIDIYIFYSYSNWRIILYFFTNLLVFNVHKYIKILIWKKLTPYWRWCRICSGKIYIHVCTITVTSPSVFDVSLIVRLRWINQLRVEINGCGWVAVGWRRLFC